MLKRDAIEILKSIQDNLEETRFLEKCAIDMGIEALKDKRPHGKWIDHQDDGYVECPFCGSATNCEYGGKEDLHYCFSCGAHMGVSK